MCKVDKWEPSEDDGVASKDKSVSFYFLCGDILSDSGHHLSKVILQKKKLPYESAIEKDNVKNKDRGLKLK